MAKSLGVIHMYKFSIQYCKNKVAGSHTPPARGKLMSLGQTEPLLVGK